MLRKVLLVAAVAAVAVPGTAAARSGIVVKVDRAAALTAVAGAKGSVALVHGKATARIGQVVVYRAGARANGTLETDGFRVVGASTRVHVRGTVLAHRGSGYVLTARGAVLAIHAPAGAAPAPPVGTTVEVTATIVRDNLDQDDVQPVLTDARSGAIEGHLVPSPVGTIAVRSGGLTLVIAVPAGIDVSKLALGDEVLASFERQADGSLVLTAMAADDRNADEQDDDTGDDDHGGDRHGGRDHRGHDG
jgi:hypothetical protein